MFCREGAIVVRKLFTDRTRLLFAIIFAGCLLRIVALLNNPAIETDGIAYARIGEALTRGHFGEALGNVFSPGYPLFIAVTHYIIPDLELAGRLVSVVFGVLLIWLSFLLGKRVLKDDDKGVWLSCLVAFHPYLVRYSGEALSESTAAFLFTLTIFSFYVALQENSRGWAVLSGFCLTLTYLTRPEYLIFYIPLILVFLWRKCITGSLALALPIFVVGSLYILYLHAQTGLWIISNKATLSPFVSVSAFFGNVPVVSLCFLKAVSPLFLVLAVIGLCKVNPQYRNLLLLLVIFHILSLSFIGHATKRYSVEFVPICLAAAVEGVYAADRHISRFFRKRFVYQTIVLLIIVLCALQAYTPVHYDRLLQKKAGLFLLSHDPGSVIAARLSIAAFYAKGNNVDLLLELSTDRNINHLSRVVIEKGIKYLIIDQKTEKEFPFLKDFLSKEKIVWSTGDRKSFVTIYRLR